MRTPLTISAIGHAAFLLWGVFSFASAHKAEPVEAVPIEVVTSTDFAKLTAGNKTAPMNNAPKPVAEKVAPERTPPEDVTAKVEKKEIKAATDKPPPPLPQGVPEPSKPDPKPDPKPKAEVKPKPEPKVEPKPEPKREAKVEPKPEPKPDPKPKPVAEKKPEPKPEPKTESKPEPKPDLIAEALKKDEAKKEETKKPEPKPETKSEAKVEPKPAKPEPKKAEAKKVERKKAEAKTEAKAETKKDAKAAARPEGKEAKKSNASGQSPREAPEFDSRNIAALLNKQTPQRLAATGDSINSTVALGAPNGLASQLSQNELGALRERIERNWDAPQAWVASPYRGNVLVRIRLKRDGTLAAPPEILTQGSGALFTAARESMRRAIIRGQPYDMLRPEHYEQWNDMEIMFDPKNMFNG